MDARVVLAAKERAGAKRFVRWAPGRCVLEHSDDGKVWEDVPATYPLDAHAIDAWVDGDRAAVVDRERAAQTRIQAAAERVGEIFAAVGGEPSPYWRNNLTGAGVPRDAKLSAAAAEMTDNVTTYWLGGVQVDKDAFYRRTHGRYNKPVDAEIRFGSGANFASSAATPEPSMWPTGDEVEPAWSMEAKACELLESKGYGWSNARREWLRGDEDAATGPEPSAMDELLSPIMNQAVTRVLISLHDRLEKVEGVLADCGFKP